VRPFAVTHGGVFRLAMPMTVAYLSTPLVGAVDTAVIGQLGDATLIGGIAIGTVIFDVLFTTCNFLRSATTGLTAQAVGAADAAEEQSVLIRALAVALAAAALMLILQAPIAALGVSAMSVEGGVAEAALAYFFVRIWATPFALLNYAVLGWVIGRGEAGAGLSSRRSSTASTSRCPSISCWRSAGAWRAPPGAPSPPRPSRRSRASRSRHGSCARRRGRRAPSSSTSRSCGAWWRSIPPSWCVRSR
jgi:hypothetical protein